MDSTVVELPDSRAKPYGWIGLPISLAAIFAMGTLLCALILLLVVLGFAAGLGWHEVLVRLTNAREALKGDPKAAELAGLVFGILFYLTTAAAVLLAARFRGGLQWRDLVAWNAWSPLAMPRACWTAVILTMVYSLAANEALAYFYPASQDWVTVPQGWVSTLLFFLVATLSAPLTEELVFRGWLYTALRAKLAFTPCLVIVSALFALAHWESTHLYALVVFPVGLALGYLREKTGSLKASMTFHAFYNGVAFVLMLFGK